MLTEDEMKAGEDPMKELNWLSKNNFKIAEWVGYSKCLAFEEDFKVLQLVHS